MAMNLLHRLYCRSNRWGDHVRDNLIPWVLDGPDPVDLGDDVLEIGPGYGANLLVLIERTPQLTAVEIDETMAARLQRLYGDRARIVRGDGTDTGLPAGRFSAVVCFTMLHHIPTAAAQDRLFAEAHRVLRPGGVFAGSDSTTSALFRLIHFRDVCNTVPPETLSVRLTAAGFAGVDVEMAAGRGVRWRAVKAQPLGE